MSSNKLSGILFRSKATNCLRKHCTYRANIYFTYYCDSCWFAVGDFYCTKKKSFGSGFGYCRRFANHSEHCLTWFYDSAVRHRAEACNCCLIFIALLPIIRNTYTGITGVDATCIKEAAMAMGMSKWQMLFKVELPLAFARNTCRHQHRYGY